jgi:hypothetical protein
MSIKKMGKSILRGAYKAKTKPLQAANMVVGAVAPNTKVSKLLDKLANPKILKNKGGKVSRYGYEDGGRVSYKDGGYNKAMKKAKPC